MKKLELSFHKSKYTEKFNNNWITINKYLRIYDIALHFEGQRILGVFNSYTTNFFSFDIDLHKKYLDESFKNIDLLNKYNYILKHFGRPSYVVKSSESGGLHVYYLLNTFCPFLIIAHEIRNLLDDKYIPQDIELLPSPTHSLALPFKIKEEGTFLDIDTLKPLFAPIAENRDKAVDIINNARKYHFVEIFGEMPEVFLKAKTKTKQLKYIKALNIVEAKEKELLPIFKNESNDKIVKLVTTYYFAGYSIEDAAKRIDSFIDNNLRDYDTSYKRILERVTCLYNGMAKDKEKYITTQKAPRQLDLFINDILDHIVEQSPFYKNRKAKLKHFLTELYYWCVYIKDLSNKQIALFDFYYPYFRHNVKKQGLIPIPRSLMIRWFKNDKRVSEVSKWLKQKKILIQKTNYSNLIGVCKYYQVNFLNY